MQRNDVGGLQQPLQRHIFGKRRAIALQRRICDQSAPEARKILQNVPPDSSRTDHADGQIGELSADIAGKRIISAFGAFQNTFGAAHRHQNQHNGIIGDASRSVCDVADGDTVLLTCDKIDMIVADGTRGNMLDAAFVPDADDFFGNGHRNNTDADRTACEGSVFGRRGLGNGNDFDIRLFGEATEISIFVEHTIVINGNFQLSHNASRRNRKNDQPACRQNR